MAEYSIKQAVDSRLDELERYLREQSASGNHPEGHEKVLKISRQLALALDREDLREADRLAFQLYYWGTEWLPWSEELLGSLLFLRKNVTVLASGFKCPYCGGNLRSANAKQCPECLKSWREP